MEDKKTLFINLFTGPGSGKSTTAAGLFFTLKLMNQEAEYVSEYAKDLTWADRIGDLRCQPYVTGKQFYRQYRVNGKVDFALVDSPVLLGIAYGGFGATPEWAQATLSHFHLFENLNIFISRNLDTHPYKTAGRNQTVDEAIEKDQEILAMLKDKNIPYFRIAPLPLQHVVEAVAQLALLVKYQDPGEVYYGIYYQEDGDDFYTDFTADKTSLDFLLESAPEGVILKVREFKNDDRHKQ